MTFIRHNLFDALRCYTIHFFYESFFCSSVHSSVMLIYMCSLFWSLLCQIVSFISSVPDFDHDSWKILSMTAEQFQYELEVLAGVKQNKWLSIDFAKIKMVSKFEKVHDMHYIIWSRKPQKYYYSSSRQG